MQPAILDDLLLLRTLFHREPAELALAGRTIWTTGAWYHRLCRALVANPLRGVMSRQLEAFDPDVGSRGAAAIIDLPSDIGMLSMRDLGWPMAELLRSGTRLNMLSLEALAAAEHLGAEICLAERDRNRPLLDAARAHGVPVRFVTVPS